MCAYHLKGYIHTEDGHVRESHSIIEDVTLKSAPRFFLKYSIFGKVHNIPYEKKGIIPIRKDAGKNTILKKLASIASLEARAISHVQIVGDLTRNTPRKPKKNRNTKTHYPRYSYY
jgi:hypothetical protein